MSTLTKKSDTHKERYVHIQIPDNARVTHATVFARLKPANERQPARWEMTVAFCSKGDHFSRRIGRTVARRRFFNAVVPRLHLGSEWSYDTVREEVDHALSRLMNGTFS